MDVYRIIDGLPLSPQHFKSHSALGKTLSPGADPCGWASCSLAYDAEKKIRTWPKYRGEKCFAAKLSIPAGSGKSFSRKNSNHIHFWGYASFDIMTAVVGTIELHGIPNE